VHGGGIMAVLCKGPNRGEQKYGGDRGKTNKEVFLKEEKNEIIASTRDLGCTCGKKGSRIQGKSSAVDAGVKESATIRRAESDKGEDLVKATTMTLRLGITDHVSGQRNRFQEKRQQVR